MRRNGLRKVERGRKIAGLRIGRRRPLDSQNTLLDALRNVIVTNVMNVILVDDDSLERTALGRVAEPLEVSNLRG